MKTCSKCKKNKNFDEFYKNSRSVSGYSAYCKPCSNEYTRKRRKSKRAYNKRTFVSDTHKECTRCKTVKSLSEFGKNSSAASGLHSWCRPCMSDKALEYRGGRVFDKLKANSTHKECRLCRTMKPYSDYSTKDGKGRKRETYCNECKKFMGTERVLKRYGLTVDTYMAMYYEQNGLCKICGREEKDGKRLSVDHDHSCCSSQHTCGNCIRGLICFKCNAALGMVEDNIDILKSMIKYLS